MAQLQPTRRPKVLTPALKAEICERVIDCETISKIARDKRMPDAHTIYRALAADHEFLQRYERAKEVQLYQMEEILLDMAGGAECDPHALERLLRVTQQLIERRSRRGHGSSFQDLADRYTIFDLGGD